MNFLGEDSLSCWVSDDDKEAYETYIALTSYGNIYKGDTTVEDARKDYLSRNESFPVDLVMGGL